ncbi:MAG: hypothetical protein U5L06_06205 [Rhodovibrio sp.]|nr:hypothetical protein [Rhodovibrio sp.]
MKLLSDKREIDSLHGRIALGFLIVQDLVVVLAMIVLSGVGVGAASGGGLFEVVRRARPTARLMLAFVGVFVRYHRQPAGRPA